MQKVNKHSVLKQVRTSGEWTGYIAPCNVRAFHINGGWHIGCPIVIKFSENGYYVTEWNSEERELSAFLNEFSYYNCNAELGRRISFWH